MTDTQWPYETPIGTLHLLASPRGLKAVGWRPHRGVARRETPLLRRAGRELKSYFAGRGRRFRVPLDIAGTAFQKRVWRELLAIPYGETRTYADIARRVGRPRAVRAVGTANGRNPLCIVVPCHRVVRTGGGLGGYSGGLRVKAALLELER